MTKKIFKYNEYIIEGKKNTFLTLYDKYKRILTNFKQVKQLFYKIIVKLTDEDLQNIYTKCKLENVSLNDLEKSLSLVMLENKNLNESKEKDDMFNKIAPRFAILVGSMAALSYANEQLHKYLVENDISNPGLITNGGEFLLLGIILYVLYKSLKWFKR